MKRNRCRNLRESLVCAVQGIVVAFKTQRNIRIHALIGAVALLLAMVLEFERVEKAVVVLTVSSVISVEMVNTSIENAVDLATGEYSRLAAAAKNAAAGAVLVVSTAALLVGILLYAPKLIALIL